MEPTEGGVSEMLLAWLARYFGRPDYLPLNHEDLRAIARAGQPVERTEGSFLYRQGEEPVAAYVLQQGAVELLRDGGRAYRCLSLVRPGAVLGDAEMFLDEPYFASARAIEPVTAFRLERDKVLDELASHPRIGLRWLVACLRQHWDCHRRVTQLLRNPLKARLADLLLEEADAEGQVSLRQREIARLLGATRSAVNRAVADLRRLGAVESGYRTLRILDREPLAALLEEAETPQDYG